MPISAFDFEVKKLTAKGEFTGLASTYGNLDLTGDICQPGCFTRSLANNRSRPLLWQHGPPCGLVTLEDSPTGLVATGQLSMGVQLAKDAYEFLKDGVVRGLSIGFQTVREEYVKGVRHLLEVKLYEVSLVTFPANEQATISGVKAAQQQQEDAIRTALRDFRSAVFGERK